MVRDDHLPSECTTSDVAALLGHRTLLLHCEIKRHRAWWRKFLDDSLLSKLAAHASYSSAAQQPAKSSGKSPAEENQYVKLLTGARALLAGKGERQGRGGRIASLVHWVGHEAGGSLEDQELAAILCGCCEGWRTDILWSPSANDGKGAAAAALAALLNSEQVSSLSRDVEARTCADCGGPGFPKTAYEVRRVPVVVAAGDHGGNAGDGSVSIGTTHESSKVVVHAFDAQEPGLMLALKVRQAKRWHDRHPACFLPLAWAVTAALAAKWEQCSGGRKEGHETTVTAKRPSPFSVLALTAAFLDKESVAKGFISSSLKTMFGGGPRISFGKTNPNLGELFLLFLSFLGNLGKEHLHPVRKLELKLSSDGAMAQHRRSSAPGEQASREEGMYISVDGEALQDVASRETASQLRKTCGDIEKALKPGPVPWLPVWRNDPRWSLLGYALTTSTSGTTGRDILSSVSRYLDWMEYLFKMGEEGEQKVMCPVLPGFTLTGGTVGQTTASIAQLNERHAADVRRARMADAAFTAETCGQKSPAEGTEKGWVDEALGAWERQYGKRLGDDDSDTVMTVDHGDDVDAEKSSVVSSSLYEGSDIDGEEMDDRGPLFVSPLDAAGKPIAGTSAGADMNETAIAGTASAADGKIRSALARGERVSQEAARAVAATKAASPAGQLLGHTVGSPTAKAGAAAAKTRHDKKVATNDGREVTGVRGRGDGEHERERARAIAKERGRQRGKQRQRQEEKEREERLKKVKELQRQREEREQERKLEIEAREKRREEEEWEEEVRLAEFQEKRRKRQEREWERRASDMDAERAKRRLRESASDGDSQRESSGSDALKHEARSSSSVSCGGAPSVDRSGNPEDSDIPALAGGDDSVVAPTGGAATSKWSPWRSVSSSDDSRSSDGRLPRTPVRGVARAGDEMGRRYSRERQSDSGSVIRSDSARRREGEADDSRGRRRRQEDGRDGVDARSRRRLDSVESSEADRRIWSRRRQLIVDVGGRGAVERSRASRVRISERDVSGRRTPYGRRQSGRGVERYRSRSSSLDRPLRHTSTSTEYRSGRSRSRESTKLDARQRSTSSSMYRRHLYLSRSAEHRSGQSRSCERPNPDARERGRGSREQGYADQWLRADLDNRDSRSRSSSSNSRSSLGRSGSDEDHRRGSTSSRSSRVSRTREDSYTQFSRGRCALDSRSSSSGSSRLVAGSQQIDSRETEPSNSSKAPTMTTTTKRKVNTDADSPVQASPAIGADSTHRQERGQGAGPD